MLVGLPTRESDSCPRRQTMLPKFVKNRLLTLLLSILGCARPGSRIESDSYFGERRGPCPTSSQLSSGHWFAPSNQIRLGMVMFKNDSGETDDASICYDGFLSANEQTSQQESTFPQVAIECLPSYPLCRIKRKRRCESVSNGSSTTHTRDLTWRHTFCGDHRSSIIAWANEVRP